MPRRGKQRQRRDDRAPEHEAEQPAGPRALWTGSISFGLLNLPVDMFPAHRTQSVSLRMVDEDGQPLRRIYFCEEHGKPLDSDEIVRGYPLGDGEFVVVTDEELEAAAPEKSREIDLAEFVDFEELDPIYFERSYYLAPEAGAERAYTLLASTMEESGKVGIATFVMRDKEHIVALVAEDGVLRAATLRFADEVRDAAMIGVEAPGDIDPKSVRAFEKAIGAASRDEIDYDELGDRYAERLRRHVEAKLAAGTDVVTAAAEQERDGRAEIVDLMEVLRERLGAAGGRAPAKASPSRSGRGPAASRGRDDLDALSKGELYERAKALDVPGRSKLDKTELADAVRKASA